MGKLFHVFAILAAVFHGVQQVEHELGPGNGLTKKLKVFEAVTPVVSLAATALGVPATAAALTASVDALVGGTVGLLHHFGVFKPKT